MDYISNDETHNYQKRKFYSKNHFKTKFLFFSNLMDYESNDGTQNCQKKIVLK